MVGLIHPAEMREVTRPHRGSRERGQLVIAVANDAAWPNKKWDVIETERFGSVIDGDFILPFQSWDHAVRELTAMRDKARGIDRGEIPPDADHEIIGGD